MNLGRMNNSLTSWENPSEFLPKSLDQKDKQNKGTNAKLEVVTINGYTKRYMVLENGKRVLISESENQESLKNDITKQEKKNNTAEVMDFLNHLMGVGSSNFKDLQMNNTQGEIQYKKE